MSYVIVQSGTNRCKVYLPREDGVGKPEPPKKRKRRIDKPLKAERRLEWLQ
jgi:hypothetical protein